jgi:hypothetical protein
VPNIIIRGVATVRHFRHVPTHNIFPKIVLLMKNDKHRKYRIIVFGKTNSTFLGPWFGGFYQMQQTGLKMTNNALHILITFVCLFYVYCTDDKFPQFER